MEEWKVYKHTSPSGKVYIGITKLKPEYRWNNGKGYQSNTRFWRAIQKYGWNNFKHEIVAKGLSQPDAEELEKALVKQYDSANKEHGYNVALGGHALSKESREKIGRTRIERGYTSHTKGKHLSEETRAKIAFAHKGMKRNHPMTEQERLRRSEAKLGEKNPNYGKKLPEERIKQLVGINSKPVVQIIGEDEVVWPSASQAGKQLGIQPQNITRACREERKTAGGYKWKYKNVS